MFDNDAGSGDRSLPAAVTWGLLAAFLVHDLEELLTMPSHRARQVRRWRERHPAVPPRLWSLAETDTVHAATGIALMGAVVGAAAAAGARSEGRSPFYQTVLLGFGLHGVAHLGHSLLARAYTPGVLTSPGVIAFSSWAWRRLRRSGVVTASGARETTSYAVLFPAVILGVHGAAHGLRRLARRAVRRAGAADRRS
ncbi:HXXEE domain-containing protein [Microbispora sp. ZYX-F-249]|uniref:HXXEE domain-containing protein n=1 Tax=Microbispora maris TaxID=3144104 RepID=A0ABV0AXX7_9ACTN